MSGLFSSFQISSSALTAQRLRMDVIANNMANADTTRTEEGGPYQKQQVFFVAEEPAATALPLATRNHLPEPGNGVKVSAILTDDTPGNRVYNPTHPDADEDGFVTYPNVNPITEMTDMLSATRSYEANITVFNALKAMVVKTLELGNK